MPIAIEDPGRPLPKARLDFKSCRLEINKDGLSSSKRPNTPGDRAQCKGDDRTQETILQPRIFRTAGNAVPLIDEGHYFAQQKIRISLALGPHNGRMKRPVGQILSGALLLRIIDAHDDQRRNPAFANQTSSSFIGLPVNPYVRSRGIEQILSVVEIEHRVVAALIFGRAVSRRQPDPQLARVAENPAWKFMKAQLSRQVGRVFAA